MSLEIELYKLVVISLSMDHVVDVDLFQSNVFYPLTNYIDLNPNLIFSLFYVTLVNVDDLLLLVKCTPVNI